MRPEKERPKVGVLRLARPRLAGPEAWHKSGHGQGADVSSFAWPDALVRPAPSGRPEGLGDTPNKPNRLGPRPGFPLYNYC